jgi:hypothetical protein
MRKILGLILFFTIMTGFHQNIEDTPLPSAQTRVSPNTIHLLRTIQVTPDARYLGGSFVRINYVPATDRFVVTFRAEFSQPLAGCQREGHAYKEYSLDMEETGDSKVISCELADSSSIMLDNIYYDVSMHARQNSNGWLINKFNAIDWKLLDSTFVPLDIFKERDNDPTVAYVNGLIDISAQFDASGKPTLVEKGAASHHHFFSTDLAPLGKKILSDVPHICGSSMIEVDGVTYFITATAYSGDLIVMKYDPEWNFLGKQDLIKKGHWSTGIAFDGQRFFLAYLDSSQRADPAFFPVYLNLHLAIFDRDWRLLQDIPVTHFSREDNLQPGRPWILLHDHRLYLSYDLDPIDPISHEEIKKWQALVSIFEL